MSRARDDVAEIVGWEKRDRYGTHTYCVEHKPESGAAPVYASEVDATDACAVCADALISEAYRRGWLG